MDLSILYIDYDLNARGSFKQAMIASGSRHKLSFSTSLGDALEKIRAGQCFDLIYTSSRFSRDALAKFIESAKSCEAGAPAVLICVCSGVSCTANQLADYATIGFEGFLFAPYSLESFRETLEIGVKLLESHNSKADELAVRLLVRATVSSMIECARRTKLSQPLHAPHAELRRTAELVRALPISTRRRFKEVINRQLSNKSWSQYRWLQQQWNETVAKASNG